MSGVGSEHMEASGMWAVFSFDLELVVLMFTL